MKALARWLGLVVLGLLALQLYFGARIALMASVAPQSTAFQRSQAWQLGQSKAGLRWRQQWVPYNQIATTLKQAVIASEDDSFALHGGVDWVSMQKAWKTNTRAQQRAAQAAARSDNGRAARIVGGSTITQQLAKNLFLSGERNLVRKGQELVLTLMLEAFLSKQRILELYLNSVEFGNGVFGAEAAAQHYFGKPAARLGAFEAARLAVMLPRPRYFETVPKSPYLSARATVIQARMGSAQLP